MAEATPSKDPGSGNTMSGMLDAIHKKQMQAVQGQLPAVVVSYDRTANRAIVRPLIAVLTTGGQAVSRAAVAGVPVLALGGGGYVLNFPLKPGDLGWIEASDRDISLFMQSLREARPNTARLHSFEDGLFVPDVFRRYIVNGEDSNAMVLQSLDGSVRIALDTGEVRLTAPRVVINAPDIEHNGFTTCNGGLMVDGIVFGTHIHGGVEPGGGTTSAPVA